MMLNFKNFLLIFSCASSLHASDFESMLGGASPSSLLATPVAASSYSWEELKEINRSTPKSKERAAFNREFLKSLAKAYKRKLPSQISYQDFFPKHMGIAIPKNAVMRDVNSVTMSLVKLASKIAKALDEKKTSMHFPLTNSLHTYFETLEDLEKQVPLTPSGSAKVLSSIEHASPIEREASSPRNFPASASSSDTQILPNSNVTNLSTTYTTPDWLTTEAFMKAISLPKNSSEKQEIIKEFAKALAFSKKMDIFSPIKFRVFFSSMWGITIPSHNNEFLTLVASLNTFVKQAKESLKEKRTSFAYYDQSTPLYIYFKTLNDQGAFSSATISSASLPAKPVKRLRESSTFIPSPQQVAKKQKVSHPHPLTLETAALESTLIPSGLSSSIDQNIPVHQVLSNTSEEILETSISFIEEPANKKHPIMHNGIDITYLIESSQQARGFYKDWWNFEKAKK